MPPSGSDLLHRVSFWQPGKLAEQVGVEDLPSGGGFPWFELACGSDDAAAIHGLLGGLCPGLTEEMLIDLLTPDEEPAGLAYGNGQIRLASSFGIEAWRPREKLERGVAQGVGVLVFQPVELLASRDWRTGS
jgi:hypothetical protein